MPKRVRHDSKEGSSGESEKRTSCGERIDVATLLEQRNELLKMFEGMERNQHTLEKMVAALKHELEVKNNELRRKNRMVILGEMAACLAHEIRNQLGGLELSAKLLKRDVEGDTRKEKPLEVILTAVAELNTLVGDMLTYTGNLVPRKEPVSIETVLARALSISRRELERANVCVVKNVPPGAPQIEIDPEMIGRVFVNIIINAAHAMPEGGTLVIEARLGDSALTVAFSDTGCGLPPEAETKLFTPFFTTKAQGTGLGLAIAYRMVREAHGGSIEGTSKADGGAVFTVRLPLTPQSGAATV
ncbi:MAG: ATP-binding protein [Planctomycetota bacterium]|nr:ATP-binding protein [Planctomycetota bacterium]